MLDGLVYGSEEGSDDREEPISIVNLQEQDEDDGDENADSASFSDIVQEDQTPTEKQAENQENSGEPNDVEDDDESSDGGEYTGSGSKPPSLLAAFYSSFASPAKKTKRSRYIIAILQFLFLFSVIFTIFSSY